MAISEKLTLEQFLALPEEEVSLEYEDGRVTQKVSPQGKHSVVQATVVDRFNRIAAPSKLAMAFPELRTTYAGYSRVPDVSVYVWPRITRDASGEVANEFREPPDIVVEIVSPGQRVNALVRRCLWYVEHGVRAAILLDPADHSALLFHPDHTTTPLHGPDRIDLQEIIPGLVLTAHDLFASLRLE
ncbi:MAG TPA: Uma2 family endonuclease [Chloroflexota bacterium]